LGLGLVGVGVNTGVGVVTAGGLTAGGVVGTPVDGDTGGVTV